MKLRLGLLAENSIPVLHQTMIDIESLDVPCGFKFPVIAKIMSGDLPHKSDIGGVRLSFAMHPSCRTPSGQF